MAIRTNGHGGSYWGDNQRTRGEKSKGEGKTRQPISDRLGPPEKAQRARMENVATNRRNTRAKIS